MGTLDSAAPVSPLILKGWPAQWNLSQPVHSIAQRDINSMIENFYKNACSPQKNIAPVK